MSIEDSLRLFHMRRQMFEADIEAIERQYGEEILRRDESSLGADKDDVYYPQLREAFRKEASRMAEHYEIFYALERSIRELVSDQLQDVYGPDWWEKAVPESVQQNVEKNIEREREQAVTPRSSEPIDYSTFGELGDIIRYKWEVFAATFNNKKGVDRVFRSLNTLRGPIAHCSPLAPDEVVRLQLAMRDWFRLME